VIAVSWHGLPQYAARLLRVFCDQAHEEVAVVGTRPQVPVRGIEEALGRPIKWIEEANSSLIWSDIGMPIPDVYVQSGWGCRPFVSLGKEVKKSGGKVIGLCDNNYRGDFRQYVGAVYFRLAYRRVFDVMFVPGQSAKRLITFYGMPSTNVTCGMYGADSALFWQGPPLGTRPKEFLFVGQFVERKGVDILCRAFSRIHENHPDWSLRLCGSGPLREQFIGLPGVTVEGFVQPEQLSEVYHRARFLVLPSLQENWGLVVHEAALCGCALLLSHAVGSAQDLGSSENAILYKAGSESALYRAMTDAIEWDDARYQEAQHVSCERSMKFGPNRFASSLNDLISKARNIV
jgi:glycosyltransferase involved in cell wall biosynthesis